MSEKPPPLSVRAWNLAQSVAAFVRMPHWVDQEEYERRLSICDACEFRKKNTCLKCGCFVQVKAYGKVLECPIGKWNDVQPDDSA